MDERQHELVAAGLARWYRGRLIPIMRGAERDPLFPTFPEDLSSLDDAALSALIDEGKSVSQKILRYAVTEPDARVADPSFFGTRSADEIHDEMEDGVSNIKRAQSEQTLRVSAGETTANELSSLAAQVEPEAALAATDPADPDPADPEDPADPDPAEPSDPEDPEAAAELVVAEDPAPEPVLAAVAPRVVRRMPPAGRHQAITAESRSGMTLVASANLSGFRPNEPLTDEWRLAEAICAACNEEVASPPGFSQKVIVAHGEVPKTEEWRHETDFTTRDGRDRLRAITAAVEQYGVTDDADALTASGGICAPVTPYYQLANVSVVLRPVRDSLVGFIADRGGIRFAPPPVISDITTAVGIITAAQDADGGSSGTKSCQTVICPEFEEVDVDSIFHCVTAGNLGARAFPEQIAQFNALVLAQHARVAETNLLNKIKAGSTNVTANGQGAGGDGAIATLLNDILVAGAGLRSRNRMMDDARLQVILPAWTGDLLVADLVASQFGRFAYNQAGVEALLDTFNIQATFTLDGPGTGSPQVFGVQNAGAVLPFPTEAQWAIFPAGSWLFVDSGVLELGIVRDSVLNATNSYQIFGESWESAAGIGVESLWVTSTICANGIVSAAAAPTGC